MKHIKKFNEEFFYPEKYDGQSEQEQELSRETLEVAPTYQCRNTHTFDKVKEVIQILQTLDNGDCVDGETMEYILEQVGMSEQMLRQLARKDPKETMEIIAE